MESGEKNAVDDDLGLHIFISINSNYVFQMRDDHDWYCFTCHSPGDMLLCVECFRAYHTQCTEEDYSGPKFTCSICKVSVSLNLTMPCKVLPSG